MALKVRPLHRELHALLFSNSVWGLLCSAEVSTMQSCETRPQVYCPYPRTLESLTISRCNYEGSTFYSECWSNQGSNPQPPAQWSDTQPAELSGRWLKKGNHQYYDKITPLTTKRPKPMERRVECKNDQSTLLNAFS